MCADSPGLGHRSSPKQQSNVNTYTLKSREVQTAIATFRQILQSCYGPSGHPKTIQNHSGGYVTTTSSSAQLLQNMTVSKPVLKLMVAAIQGHTSKFSDGGLYCGLLMSYLVDTCTKLDLHPVLCINVNEHMAGKCLEVLNSIKIPIDVSNMGTMLHIVQSVIGSKPLCNLTAKELDYVSTLVLEAFLKTVPNFESTNSVTLSPIECVAVVGLPPHNSCVIDGVLLEATKFLTGSTNDLTISRVKSGPLQGQIRVALYNISMSGDSENFADVNYEVVSGVSADAAVISQMFKLADKLVADEVGLVACQKVIHPSVKKFLKEKDVWTLDRLSRLHIDAVQKVTGAQVLSTFNTDLQEEAYGYLEDLQVVEKFNKKYLHLQNTGSHPVCTLALCSRTHIALEELKNVCSVANQTLALILSNPMALPGAGCTETYIANQLRQTMTSVSAHELADLRCTRGQFLAVANNFASCFDSIAMALEHDGGNHVTDVINHHRYCVPPGVAKDSDWLTRYSKCACRMTTFTAFGKFCSIGKHRTETMAQVEGTVCVSNDQSALPNSSKSCETQKSDTDERTRENLEQLAGEPLILDCLSAKRNALCIAVETANMVLRIKHTIEDTN